MENLNEQKGLLMKSHSSFFSALSNGVVLMYPARVATW